MTPSLFCATITVQTEKPRIKKGHEHMRQDELFDNGWLFHLGDIETPFPSVKGPAYVTSKTQRMKSGPASVAYNDRPDDYRMDDEKEIECERWINVTLPHDFLIMQPVDAKNNNAFGFVQRQNGWYRKHFTVPKEDEGKRITLLFEAVATHATVYLNGCLMKHNFCGYTSFEVDITDMLKYGEDNVLAVYVVTKDCHEGWWYEGGGIYRHVHLIKTSPVCIELWGVYAMPRPDRERGGWYVPIETAVLNETYEDKHVCARTRIEGADGEILCEADGECDIPLREKRIIKYTATAGSPLLWSTDEPNLYRVITDIYYDGVLTDTYVTRCGFRDVVMDANEGLFINGKHTTIRGVCAHHGCGLTGKAVPDNIMRYQVQLLKDMGVNGFRTSHYPHGEATMDALDELGFLVMDETRWFESTDEGKEQLTMLMKRDRNRPSVIFWSVGNEEPHHCTPEGKRIARSLMALAHKLDSTRCIMTAVDHPERATVYDELEAIGVNYNIQRYDEFHAKYPNKPFFSSEFCATGTTRGWYFDDDSERGHISAYDHDTNDYFVSREKSYKLTDRKWIMGGYQWTGLEYRGEAQWPRLCSQSGAIDLFLQKKDAFYQNRSFFTEEPMVHLLPHWNWSGFENEDIRVFAYTNCDEVALLLNGKEIGRRSVERFGHAEWQVRYVPGTLKAIAYRNGKEVAHDTRITSEKPHRLRLRLDNEAPQPNGRDMAIVTCWVEDENGIAVPDASPTVSFMTNSLGHIHSTGSDVSDHVPLNSPDRRMYAGLVTAAVQVGDQKGTLKVYATSPGLVSAVLNIEL